MIQITQRIARPFHSERAEGGGARANPEAVSLALREFAPEPRTRRTSACSWASSSRCGSGRRSSSITRRGRATRGDAEAGADPVRQAFRPLRARALRAHPHRDPARPSAVPAPDMPRFDRGACAPSAAARPPEPPPPRCSAAIRGRFREQPRAPRWPRAASNAALVGVAVRALEAVRLQTQTAEGLRGGDRGGDGAVKGPASLSPDHSLTRRWAAIMQQRCRRIDRPPGRPASWASRPRRS